MSVAICTFAMSVEERGVINVMMVVVPSRLAAFAPAAENTTPKTH